VARLILIVVTALLLQPDYLPELTDEARAIYERGSQNATFSRIGDCMTAAEEFLTPFAGEDYDLGDYGDLQAVIDYFATSALPEDSNPFSHASLSAHSGFNTAAALDPLWANPEWCEAGETPLACEYRIVEPGFALIMFGTNDVYYLDAESFNTNLREIVEITIDHDVVPLLHTFPLRSEFPEKTEEYNALIVEIAGDYDVPLIDLALALADLPGSGVDAEETIHLSIPEDGLTGVFDEDHLAYGYTMRNLVTLQTLDGLLRELNVLEGSDEE
jgi:hypothetical protein